MDTFMEVLRWQSPNLALSQSDPEVARFFEQTEAAAKTGVPRAIISDKGS